MIYTSQPLNEADGKLLTEIPGYRLCAIVKHPNLAWIGAVGEIRRGYFCLLGAYGEMIPENHKDGSVLVVPLPNIYDLVHKAEDDDDV